MKWFSWGEFFGLIMCAVLYAGFIANYFSWGWTLAIIFAFLYQQEAGKRHPQVPDDDDDDDEAEWEEAGE